MNFSKVWLDCLRLSSISSSQMIELSHIFNAEAKKLLTTSLGKIEKISAEVNEINSELRPNIDYLNDSISKV